MSVVTAHAIRSQSIVASVAGCEKTGAGACRSMLTQRRGGWLNDVVQPKTGHWNPTSNVMTVSFSLTVTVSTLEYVLVC